jgi:hypothetical protein
MIKHYSPSAVVDHLVNMFLPFSKRPQTNTYICWPIQCLGVCRGHDTHKYNVRSTCVRYVLAKFTKFVNVFIHKIVHTLIYNYTQLNVKSADPSSGRECENKALDLSSVWTAWLLRATNPKKLPRRSYLGDALLCHAMIHGAARCILRGGISYVVQWRPVGRPCSDVRKGALRRYHWCDWCALTLRCSARVVAICLFAHLMSCANHCSSWLQPVSVAWCF